MTADDHERYSETSSSLWGSALIRPVRRIATVFRFVRADDLAEFSFPLGAGGPSSKSSSLSLAHSLVFFETRVFLPFDFLAVPDIKHETKS